MFVRALITWGSTTSITAVAPGTVEFSLPKAATSSGVTANANYGVGEAFDVSLARRAIMRSIVNTTTLGELSWLKEDGNVIFANSFNTTNTPFALTTSDLFQWSLIYEAA